MRYTTAYQLYHLMWNSLDWLYPPVCGGCAKLMGERYCLECLSGTQVIKFPLCPICGTPQTENKICEQCQQKKPPYQGMRSWGIYAGPLRQAILKLKYHRDIALGEAFTNCLVECFEKTEWEVDLIIPVPSSPKRTKERGFNHAAMLAYPVALAKRIPYSGKALYRIMETIPQADLKIHERHKNVKNVFSADHTLVKQKHVMIIDNIVTTGATMSECALTLKKAGADKVYALTLARTILENKDGT